MAYIYADVENLEGTEKVGSKQCVALLQHYSQLPNTSIWKEGKSVLGDLLLAKGTAIATFVNGKYESNATGNHAAYYISQDNGGILGDGSMEERHSKAPCFKTLFAKKG